MTQDKIRQPVTKSIQLWIGVLALALAGVSQADYSQHAEAHTFVTEMVRDHGFTQAQLSQWLTQAEKQQTILDAIARPAEKTKTWKQYRPIFIQPLRIENGVKFWRAEQVALERAEQTYGVPAEIIVAIIGVETNYGRNTGSYSVLNALTTLAFDYPPRAPFFRKELQNFFLLTREQQQDPLKLTGSYAGAMGYGQFMPSSYRAYAVDFDGDGFTDIWHNTTDAIGSVANYFKQHGWQAGAPVVARVRFEGDPSSETFNEIKPPISTVKEWQARGFTTIVPWPDETPVSILQFDGQHGLEYWFGTQNFYAITRYNRSPLYAMAVQQLSQLIKQEMETLP